MARGANPGERRGGRTRGTPNKRTLEVQERLQELGCDPIEGMVRIAKSAEKDGDKALAGQMYKELAQYVAPKRKMLDVVSEQEVQHYVISDTPEMTSEEWVKRYKPKEQTI